MPDVLVTATVAVTVTVADSPPERRGELRAWALDDETDDWCGHCQYRERPEHEVLDWFHESQLRRDGDLTDDDGLVDPGRVVARSRSGTPDASASQPGRARRVRGGPDETIVGRGAR